MKKSHDRRSFDDATNAIKQWVASPVIESEEEERRRASFLNLVLLGTILLLALLIVGNWLGGRTPARIQISNAVELAVFLLFLRWLRAGKVNLAAAGALIVGYVGTTVAVAMLGTIRTPTTSFYLFFVLMAGVLLHARGLVVAAIASSVSILGLILAENAGMLPQPDFRVGVTQWFTYTVLLFLASSLIHYNNLTTRRALARAENEIKQRKQTETEHHRAQQMLQKNEQLLCESQEAARIGSYINTFETGTFESTGVLDEIFGITRDYPHTNEAWANFMHPDFKLAMEEAFLDSINNKKPFDAEYKIIRPSDGAVRWLHGLGQITYDDQGKAVSLIGTVQDITERKRIEEEIGEQRRFLDAVIDNVNANIYIKDHDGRYLFVNPAVAGLYGRPVASILGRSDLEIFPLQIARQLMEFDSKVRQSGGKLESEEILTDSAGNVRYYWSVKIPIEMRDHPHALIGFSSDITERKSAEEAQRIAAAAFESQQAMFITGANKVILRVNKAFTEITGFTAEEAVGQTPSQLKSDRQDAAFYAAMWDSIKRRGTWQGEIWNRRKNGEEYPEHLNISTVKNEADVLTHYVCAFSDLTSQNAAEEQSRKLAYTDMLTGLPNRVMLIVRLQQAVMAAEKQNHRGALLMVDLDHFKNINDSLGPYHGDEVLKCIARRLSALVLRESETVARLGGDEFGVLLDHLSPDPQTAFREVETVTHKILEAIREPYQIAHSLVSCTASIGITLLGTKQEQVLDSLKQAELAMFQAKSAGGNDLRFFDPKMQATINARVALEAGLREAILNKQFTLHYQAQVSDSESIIGVEALLRWVDPKRGVVSPAEFIPLAEETGLILPIGAWVLETACQQLAAWAHQPRMAHLSIAVNVSARQFRESSFVDQVLAALERSGANANRLKLEPTESVLITDIEGVIAKMTALRSHGVGFAIDDFGTGYSSLAYLKRLPLEKLKIDQSFVRDILTSPDDAAIARAIIAMATSMGMGVIAEGVETEAQRDLLASMGCHTYQGYLFSKPLPVQEFEKLMQERCPEFVSISKVSDVGR